MYGYKMLRGSISDWMAYEDDTEQGLYVMPDGKPFLVYDSSITPRKYTMYVGNGTSTVAQLLSGSSSEGISDVQVNGSSVVINGVAYITIPISPTMFYYNGSTPPTSPGTLTDLSEGDMCYCYTDTYGVFNGMYLCIAITELAVTWKRVDNQVNDVQDGTGTSLVSGGVATVPLPTSDQLVPRHSSSQFDKVLVANSAGELVWKSYYIPGNVFGTGAWSQVIQVIKATDNLIKVGVEDYKPIVPHNQHISVFYGLAKAAGDTTQASSSNPTGTYTDDAKEAIQTMIGILSSEGVGF